MTKTKSADTNSTENNNADAARASVNAEAKGGREKQPAPQMDPELAEKITSLRSHVRGSFGKTVMSMMMLPRYRHQTLGDLQYLVLEPLIRDRVAIAQRAGDDAAAQDIAGVAIWASLSDEAEGRLREQIASGTWPIRLKAEDWNSGQNHWLIDVIASDQRATASVIANFRQVVKEGSLKLHPLITRLVDEETLKSMGASKAPPEQATEAKDKMPEKIPEGEMVN